MSILEYKVLQVPHYSQRFPHLVKRVKVKLCRKVQRSLRSYPNLTKMFRRALKDSVQCLMDWAVLNSVMQLGEEIKKTEGSRAEVAVITFYIKASWLEKSPTNWQSSVLNASSD